MRAASYEFDDNNIIFFTYAKLMLMPDEELMELVPAYIIPDEFSQRRMSGCKQKL